MVEVGNPIDNTNETANSSSKFVFWGGDGKIIPHLLFEYFGKIGIGKYYPEDTKWKKTEPVIVRIDGNIVSEVNVSYLLEIAKNYIDESLGEEGKAGPVLDSLHKNTSLFGDKNLKLLPALKLGFISDTRDAGHFFFKNGVVKVTSDAVTLHSYGEFDQYIWESNILNIDYIPVAVEELPTKCDFSKFLIDLTIVQDTANAAARLRSLKSAVGYLLHNFKDGNTNKAIILMDVYVNGSPNGGSGKTLLICAIGKVRNLAVIDGKKYDQREWFALSSVGLDSEVLLFDDVNRDFNFEQLFPLMSGGMLVRRKFKDHIHIPHEKSPKIAITTNYAINGDSSSHRRRKFEFEVSATYSAEYSPRDKFERNFFDDWLEHDWNLFYNTMINCLQGFLKDGLLDSEPISLRLAKLMNATCEEFVEFGRGKILPDTQIDKKQLYDDFLNAFPEYKYQLKQRTFTHWLRSWGAYKKYKSVEGHSGNTRYIIYSESTIV